MLTAGQKYQRNGKATPTPLTAPALADLREVTDSNEPGSANISLKGGKAKMSYWWASTSAADFENVATLILGSAAADPNPTAAGAKPGIIRKMPIGHPRFPTLYAETITDFAGLGKDFVKEGSALQVAIPNFPQYARYPQYRIDIEFANRMYFLEPDPGQPGSGLTVSSLTWYDDNGSGSDVTKKCWDTQEYYRWLWVAGGPKESILTAKQGQNVLDTYPSGTLKAQAFNDFPKMPMPDGTVVFHWFEVPYSFVRPANPVSGASWFQLFQGRVNQTDFGNWKAGELMYVTISPKPYNSPIPDASGNIVVLCDIDIICMETKRILNDPAPAAPAAGGRLKNWIAAGWNLQPWWKDRQFHYAHVGDLTGTLGLSQQVPSWKSFPMQILFSNPEVTLPP